MADPIEFYFDFSSPYGYLAAKQIDTIAADNGRTIKWCPILLGFIFKVTESKPLVQVPLKGAYSLRDMNRCAREKNIAFSMPDTFPVNSIAAARTVLWAGQQMPELQQKIIHAIYDAYFIENIDISDPTAVVDIASKIGVDKHELNAALEDKAVKAMLKTAVDEAVEKGVFGSPFIIVDGEPFWGHDRLDQVTRWLATGGW